MATGMGPSTGGVEQPGQLASVYRPVVTGLDAHVSDHDLDDLPVGRITALDVLTLSLEALSRRGAGATER